MKKAILILVLAVSTAMVFNACSGSSADKTDQTDQKPKVEYTCTMHPEVVEDKPGDCPKCGMALVEKKADNQMDSTMMK